MKKIIFTFVIGTFLFHQPLFAQAIDPAVLEALKTRGTTAGGDRRVVSPLDQARQQEYADRQNLLLEQRKKALAEISRLEEDYQSRLNSGIMLHGYSIFANLPSAGSVMTGTISDNYKLGIGDEFIVTFQGSNSQAYTVRADLEGRVIIPELKPINVMGMSYGDFKTIVKKQVAESIIGTEVYISLASVRSISVFVVGEVGNPGIIQTSSLATPLEIIMNAGGGKKDRFLEKYFDLSGW